MKKNSICFILIFCMLSTSSCWDKKIYNELDFALNIGLESSNEPDKIIVSAKPKGAF